MFHFKGLCYFKRGLHKQVNCFLREGKAERSAAGAGLCFWSEAAVSWPVLGLQR